MRSHGVQVSDPVHRPGHAGLSIDMPSRGPATNAAYAACIHFIQANITAKQAGAAAKAAPHLAALTRYAQCMRSHDINMLDPTPLGELNLGHVPGITSDFGRYSPQFRAADAACRHFLPAGDQGRRDRPVRRRMSGARWRSRWWPRRWPARSPPSRSGAARRPRPPRRRRGWPRPRWCGRTWSRTALTGGTLGYAAARPVVNLVAGIYTWLPRPGALVRAGGVLYRVDDSPVTLMAGPVPAWRPFGIGMTDGPDVRQLQAGLIAGHFAGGLFTTPTGHYDLATADAVERWQAARGLTVTGIDPARAGGLPAHRGPGRRDERRGGRGRRGRASGRTR